MNIVFALIVSIVVVLFVLLYYAVNRMIKDHNELHTVDTDEDLDLTKTL